MFGDKLDITSNGKTLRRFRPDISGEGHPEELPPVPARGMVS
jgi:hypothetical protein